MTSNWSVCGVCDYRHLSKPSVVWCLECDEGLCEECKEHHGISKGTRNHGTVCITEYKKLPKKVLQLALSCDKHNEKYQIFCKKHDCPCCKKCIVETHNDCKELIDIDDISRFIKSSNAFAELQQTLSEVAANVKRLRIHREENLVSLGKKSREIEKEVQETRAEINQHLDKLQDDILKELKKREAEESNKIRRILNALMDTEHEITEHQTNISNIKQNASELQTFLALKHIEKDVLTDEKYIQSMIKSDGANQINVSCQINPSLTGFLTAIQKFGDIVVTADPCKIPILNKKDRQAQMMVPVTPITIDSLAPTLLHTLFTKLLSVRGCTLLLDRRMVLSGLVKQVVQVFKPDGSLDFEIKNVDPVFDVTYIGAHTVAVTSGYYKKSLRLSLVDLQTRKVTRTLKVNSINSGVAYISDKLIYCAGNEGIHMISLNDESIVNVTKSKVTTYSYVATYRNNIVHTNCNEDSVTCMDFQGNIQWVFKNGGVLRAPYGVSIDGDGNVYVVGNKSNNVVVISPNGQNYRQLVSSENGIRAPSVINIDRSSNTMLVANEKDNAFLYSLK